jgi:DNA-binding FadR family transcriptional regulator
MAHHTDTPAKAGDQRPRLVVGPWPTPDGGPRQQKTTERVAVEIVRDLVTGGACTGDHLPLEAEMVLQYGVSRASVREALRLLEVQGLIHLKPGPGGGPVVGSVDPAHLARTTSLFFHLGGATYDSVLWTQSLLEPVCAQLAARSPDRQRAMRRYLAPGPVRVDAEFRRHAERFHAEIYRLAANPIVVLLTQAITQIAGDHALAMTDPPELRGPIVREHATLAQAIYDGRPDVAGRVMAEHLRAQHDHYRANAPERLRDVIQWR